MASVRSRSRSGFTLLEAVLGLVLLSTIALVTLAACQRALLTLRRAEALDNAVKRADRVAADPLGKWEASEQKSGDLRLRIETHDRGIAAEIVMKEWSIVAEEAGARGPLCKLQFLSRGAGTEAASRSSRH